MKLICFGYMGKAMSTVEIVDYPGIRLPIPTAETVGYFVHDCEH